jgi:prophage tail gpP-like protein
MILKINDRFINRKVDFFNEFSVTLVHDSVASVFGCSFYFDPNNKEHKEFACVSHYHEVQVEHKGELLITGVMTSQNFKRSAVKSMASFGGYSKPGVLEDCEIPTSLYPLQTDGMSLKQITERLINPFKLKLIVDSSVSDRVNKTFKTSNASETQTIKGYLTELATQKNIIITHDEFGNLLFTESKTTQKPIIDFIDGVGNMNGTFFPATDIELNFDGQGMHSHITLQKQASEDGGNAGEHTIRNPYVIGSYFRPAVKSQSSGDDNDTTLAARQELSKELKGLKLTIKLDRWDINGKIIRPNNIISIYDPEIYIWKKTEFFIESVDFQGNEKSQTCTLHCVLPEVYQNGKVNSIFAGINLHPGSGL